MILRPDIELAESWRPAWRIADAPLVFVDLETTGLHPERGQLITQAAVLGDDHIRLHADIEGDDDSRVVTDLLEILRNLIIVGHNVGFDMRFLAERASRLDLEVPALAYIDTMHLARSVLGIDQGQRSLRSVATHLGIALPEQLHQALPDARLARAVFTELCERHDLSTLADAHVRRFVWHHD